MMRTVVSALKTQKCQTSQYVRTTEGGAAVPCVQVGFGADAVVVGLLLGEDEESEWVFINDALVGKRTTVKDFHPVRVPGSDCREVVRRIREESNKTRLG